MGQIGVAITNLPTVIFLKKPFSDGLGGDDLPPLSEYTFYLKRNHPRGARNATSLFFSIHILLVCPEHIDDSLF
jgi:hypothetical protein